MSRNLKEKIALGVPLTDQESKELLTDSKALQLAEGMHSIDLLAESIRHEKPSTEVLTRLRCAPRRADFRRTPRADLAARLAYSAAALVILGITLFVAVNNDLAAGPRRQEDFRQPPRTGLELYAVKVSSWDGVSGKMIHFSDMLVRPYSDGDLKPGESLPSDPKNRGFVLDATYFLPSMSLVKRLFREHGGVFGTAFTNKKQLWATTGVWLRSEKVEPALLGPAIAEVQGRMTRLQKWTLSNPDSSRRITFFGTSLDNLFPRVEFQKKVDTSLKTVVLYETREVDLAEYNRLKTDWARANRVRLAAEARGRSKP